MKEMKTFQTIHLWGKGMKYLGNIIMARPKHLPIFSETLETLVEQWGDKRKVCYVTFE